MADPHEFPHLKWTHEGPFTPGFGRAVNTSEEAAKARKNPAGHSAAILDQVDRLRDEDSQRQKKREAENLPDLKGKSFLLRVPENTDVDALAHTLGIELVAETQSGLMFAASDDLDLKKLEEVLSKFSIGKRGGGSAASILEIFQGGDDERKLDELLVGPVRQQWPFGSDTTFIFDLGIQTASSSKTVEWTRLPKRPKNQSDEEREKTVEEIRRNDRIVADETWDAAAEERLEQLREFIEHYHGEEISGLKADTASETSSGIVFPDSVQVRVRMSGRGFQDLVQNFPHLFEVAYPPEFETGLLEPEEGEEIAPIGFASPPSSAAKVCVIDSGIQQDHSWLSEAIDSETSRCFLPEKEEDEVADEVYPRGHGTRVAGAVLFPEEIPQHGTHDFRFWIQNARVLDQDNDLPDTLPPDRYLTEVVQHFQNGKSRTKIFNHSINAKSPCESKRMSAWAAKLDDLTHKNDVLFIQSSGNINPITAIEDFGENFEHPEQLLEEEAGIANPAQSFHALTVGSVSNVVLDENDYRTFSQQIGHPSSFSRSGYSPLWNLIKPELVEYGGEYVHAKPLDRRQWTRPETAPELLASTLHGEAPFSSDQVGTSFAAPKVAHIAAELQNLFPNASPQLYRALLVQSARWPAWWENEEDPNVVLKTIGYGIPSLERAITNDDYRITMVTSDTAEIWSKQYHLYHIPIPEEIRRASLESKIRVDVTLAYSATPRRTRSRRTGYLETWLEWRSINDGESLEHFKARMEGNKERSYPQFSWCIHQDAQHGMVQGETRRDLGSVQKDWTVIEANNLPEDFAIAVRAHVGWNHKEQGGAARYCLVVSFESLSLDLPIYNEISQEIEAHSMVEENIQNRV